MLLSEPAPEKKPAELAAKEIDQLRAGIRAKGSFIQSKQEEVSDLKKELDRQNAELSRVAAENHLLKIKLADAQKASEGPR